MDMPFLVQEKLIGMDKNLIWKEQFISEFHKDLFFDILRFIDNFKKIKITLQDSKGLI